MLGRPHSSGQLTFCIPLLPRKNARDWDRVVEVLTQTLRSLAGQTNQSFSLIMAGQNDPGILQQFDFPSKFLAVDYDFGDRPEDKLKDKRWKRNLMHREVRALGGGYVMALDADDLISSRLVDHVLTTAHPYGYIIENGYAFDWANQRLAPIPGAFSSNFDKVCGSCSIIYYGEDDLPQRGEERGDKFYYRLKGHAAWAPVMAEAGRPLEVVPFPAAVYVLNHDNNLHNSISPSRETVVPRSIEKQQVPITPELIREFSLPVELRP
jgi:hypothetical protein